MYFTNIQTALTPETNEMVLHILSIPWKIVLRSLFDLKYIEKLVYFLIFVFRGLLNFLLFLNF